MSRRRYLPGSVSVDAAPRSGPPEYQRLKHSPKNLVITSATINFGKYTYLRGAIHRIGHFLRGDHSQQERQALLSDMHRISTTELHARYILAGRGDIDQRWRAAYAVIVCGEATEVGAWTTRASQITRNTPPVPGEGRNLWSEEVYKRSQTCARDIASYFDVELPTTDDGMLWFSGADANPEGMHGNTVALLMRERLCRIRTQCNEKWDTIDDEESLYKEIIFQYCASVSAKKDVNACCLKYGDRLCLPLTLFWNSPLRISVAHRYHGAPMYSVWSSKVTNVRA